MVSWLWTKKTKGCLLQLPLCGRNQELGSLLPSASGSLKLSCMGNKKGSQPKKGEQEKVRGRKEEEGKEGKFISEVKRRQGEEGREENERKEGEWRSARTGG